MSDPAAGIVLIACGGRDYLDYRKVREVLDFIHAQRTIWLLVHGAAGRCKLTYRCPGQQASGDHYFVKEGADLFAEEWAFYNRVPSWPYAVTEEDWKRHGKRAGPIRNGRMLRERNPDAVLAFPGGKGTRNMVDQAQENGVEVWLVSDTASTITILR